MNSNFIERLAILQLITIRNSSDFNNTQKSNKKAS